MESVSRVEVESLLKSALKKTNVLMVTGVYFPEINGAALQCLKIISLLKSDFNFNVLTSTTNRNQTKNQLVEDISCLLYTSDAADE